jgi:hypothetical protein
MKNFTTAIFLFLNGLVYGQITPIWQTQIGGDGGDFPYVILKSSNGDYILGGTSTYESSQFGLYPSLGINVTIDGNSDDIFLARYSENGELLWWTFFGGQNLETIQTINEDSQGNLWIAGLTYGQVPTSMNAIRPDYINSGITDGFIAKFSSTGNWLDGTLIGGDQNDVIDDIRIHDDGRIFIAGLTSSVGLAVGDVYDSELSNERGAFVAVLNSLSQVESFSYFEGNNDFNEGFGNKTMLINESFEAILYCGSDSDSGIISGDAQFTEPFLNDPSILVKLSFNGEPIWGSYFFGSSLLFGSAPAGSDKFVLYGIVFPGALAGTSGTNQTEVLGNDDGMISLWNNEGEMQWATYFGTNYSSSGVDFVWERFSDIFYENDRIYFCGYVKSQSNISTQNSWIDTVPSSTSNVSVFGWFSLTGQLEYCSYFFDSEVSSQVGNIVVHNEELLLSAVASGELSFAPPTSTNQSPQGFADIHLVKFDLSTNVAETNEIRAIQAYPNPAREEVVFSGVNMIGAQVEVFDMQGKLCLHQTTHTRLDVSALHAGVYLAKVRTTNGEVGSCRLVIE